MTETLRNAVPGGNAQMASSVWAVGWALPIAAAAVILAGAAFAAWHYFGPIAQAHAAVRDSLVDPQSAQFRNDRNGKGTAICGEVNARNQMGGYVGFQRYVWIEDRGAVLVSLPDFDAIFSSGIYGYSVAFSKLRGACSLIKVWSATCGTSNGEADIVRRCEIYAPSEKADSTRPAHRPKRPSRISAD